MSNVTKNSNFTPEAAQTKLNKATVISEVHSQRVEISSIIEQQKDGKTFGWVDADGVYHRTAIVNLNCFTEYNAALAQKLIDDGKIIEASGKHMSFNLPFEMVDKFKTSSYCNAEFRWTRNKDNTADILVVSKLYPIEIKAAPKATFSFQKKGAPTESITPPVVKEFDETV